ncbi:MAG: monovalent cation/H(+) antiporter subunit G [Pseudomonadota bacterium]
MEAIIDVVSAIFIIGGIVFCLIGAFGILKMPSFITRAHSASLLDSGGAIMLLTGLILKAGFTLVAAKLVLVLIFLMLAGPTAIHALMATIFLKDSNLISNKDSSSNT